MDSKLSAPLLTPSMRYSEWKMNMIASMKREDLYEVSIGLGKESYEDDNELLNDGDRAFHYYISIQNPMEKFDSAWISLFKLTKNHKDTFFFVNVATSVA